MASPASHHPTDPVGSTPKAIRSALLPEEVADFDQAYQHALRTAADTLSLEELQATLQHWHRIARMTQVDPEAHRQMLQRAAETRRTGELPTGSVPSADVKALIRERLGL